MNIDEKIKIMEKQMGKLSMDVYEKQCRARESKHLVNTATTYTERKKRVIADNNCRKELYEALLEKSDFSKEKDKYIAAVCRYAKFTNFFILEALAAVISLYRGEEYVVRHAHYHLDNDPNYMEETSSEYTNNPLIIVSKEYDALDYYQSKNDLEELIKNGKAILLRENEYPWMKKAIYFYGEIELMCLTHLAHIPYALDFIDYVIEYRIEHSLDDISDEIMIQLLCKFIDEHIEEISQDSTIGQEELSKKEIVNQLQKKKVNKSSI